MSPGDSITKYFHLGDSQKKALRKLGVITAQDLLYHFPARYDNAATTATTDTLTKGEKVVLYGKISKPKTSKGWKSKIPMAEAYINDATGRVKAVWFHQPYIAKMFMEGVLVKVEGIVSERNGELYLSNPAIEKATAIPREHEPLFTSSATSPTNKLKNFTTNLLPVYPESRGVTSRWFYYSIQKMLRGDILEHLTDPIPPELLKRYNLPTLSTALTWIHSPQKVEDAVAARKRFAFEEVFFIQLQKQMERSAADHAPSFVIDIPRDAIDTFVARFTFTPTNAQKKAITEILTDFKKPHAMSRLLEGDVGSGKTFVAAATAHAVVITRPKGQTFGNLQVAYMAPTEILAKQHFESFIQFFKHLPIQIGLITGGGCKKFPSKVRPDATTDISRAQLLKWVANGEIPILIGTHALIQKSVVFKHLACVYIDEQHRFGTRQRAALAKKEKILPHLLSMTATPIPRTLALTIYGDLDLTLLDEMPAGRKPVATEIVGTAHRTRVYTKIREELAAGRQLYVICPRIDEPDPAKEFAMQATSVTEEAARLKKEVFPEYAVGILHSKMTTKEKDRVMHDFAEGKTHILVSTSVVEVGVNVPNATVMTIEGGERFGLSQLHQLRGRILRSNHQAHCFIFTDSKSKPTLTRLKAIASAKNGFELAEKDLELRGAGELYGGKQWGISDVGMEALRNLKMVEAARKEAHDLIANDPTLSHHPLLKSRAAQSAAMHFE